MWYLGTEQIYIFNCPLHRVHKMNGEEVLVRLFLRQEI
jgi:hypothetical protein